MTEYRQRRIWLPIAAIAIGFALVLMLAPSGHSSDASHWVAILPLLFVGMISPLSLLSPLAYAYVGRAPEAPALPLRFQRPPPSNRA
jgi:hypothetical protein